MFFRCMSLPKPGYLLVHLLSLPCAGSKQRLLSMHELTSCKYITLCQSVSICAVFHLSVGLQQHLR